MALLLHIDTATPIGSVCLSEDGKILAEKISNQQRNHASVIVPFIKEILQEAGKDKKQIEGIVVSSGPGSYTGLRVATSTAKGLCYAWDVPLIAIPTLEMMAYGMKLEQPQETQKLFCPLIDARRKEVFTALYDVQMNELLSPSAVILTTDFLKEYQSQSIIIAGTGEPKAKTILGSRPSFTFCSFSCKASYMIDLAEKAFEKQKFENVAYFEPFYLKSVYLPPSKKRPK